MPTGGLPILVIEDDDIDVEYLKRQFAEHQLNHPLLHVGDGKTALALLRGEGHYRQPERPWLILLDLHLPGMSGLEFLRRLRAEPTLSRCPVFVLTASDHDEDKRAAYAERIAGYVLKQKIKQDFSPFAHLLKVYQTIELPM